MAPEDWPGDDPFLDPDDPAAVERARRRREREEKRRARQAASPPEPEPDPEPDPDPEPAPPAALVSEPSSAAPEPSSAAPEQPEPASEAPAPERPAQPLSPPEEVGEGSVLADDPLPPEERFRGSEEDREEPVPSVSRGPRARRLRGRLALAALGVVLVIGVGFAWALFQPFHGDGSGRPFVVRVPKGSSVSEIGDLLADRGAISNSTLFQIRVTLAGKRSELYPGRHLMREDMSYSSAIDELSLAPVKRTVNVAVPEGLSRLQIAAIARQDGLRGSYLRSTVSAKGFHPNAYGAQGRARNLEGFLFPATYEMPKDPGVDDLVQRQLDTFRQRIRGVDMSYAEKKNLTVYDVLIIASMIEDEGVQQDFRDIAAVVYNRLHDGIALGIDATVRFAVGNYDSPLTESELATDSPYNTRINSGLPPGPIGNPGMAAIRAAANPSQAGYLYYVTKPGSCNRLSFSSTNAQFQRDVAAYNQARAAAGGNSPTSCG
ncbi:MAG: endolytic transglycosylase MltG [Solirubrobacterales bacterium]